MNYKTFAKNSEKWKPVRGYETVYEVSSYGNVRRYGSDKNLKPGLSAYGYPRVNLYSGKTLKTKFVHRLVAEAFITNIFGKKQINHKDGKKDNNSVFNLEWCTPSENMQHAYDTGLKVASPRNKFSDETTRRIVKMYKNGIRQSEIAKMYGVNRATIFTIIKRLEGESRNGY